MARISKILLILMLVLALAGCEQGTQSSSNQDKANNDKMSGNGIYTFKNGDTYTGEWKNNNIDGKGKYTYKNGNVKEGIWENGKFIRSDESNTLSKGKSDVLANSKNTVSQSNIAEQNKIQEVPKIETADDVPQIPQVEILTPIPC
ncbi:hypothetical protein [Clostridium coskatii]|uniref:MORN repeat protein n=1 Tax=Clostridium coskatii TaxID=1705578 RepID=A0A168MGR4_9CLOT|nr:hypothetical protein [Clostridium coskatii]OAA84670.1 MORN repeat protein [Clostridium coskatii]OBR90240.1 MORN repeat protein [Clostridium coskatii]